MFLIPTSVGGWLQNRPPCFFYFCTFLAIVFLTYQRRKKTLAATIAKGVLGVCGVVLEGMLLESDADIEIWYCCGLAYKSQELYKDAMPYLETAATMIAQLPAGERVHMEEQVGVTLNEVKEILAEMGLSLGMKLHNFPRLRDEE